MISFNYHSVYVLQHPVPLSNVRFQLTKKTKRGFIMVFYVKIMRKEVFIVLVHTVSARSTTSILEVGCNGGFFFLPYFLPSVKKNIQVPFKRKKHSRGKIGLLWFSEEKTRAVLHEYGLCAWCACHLFYIFSIIQTHAYSHTHRPCTVFRVGRITFFLVNRVKNQTNQNCHRALAVWVCFGFQLGPRQIRVLILIYTMLWSKGLRALYW